MRDSVCDKVTLSLFQSRLIQHLDLAARRADEAAGRQVFEQAADDFARSSQFGCNFLMGDAHRVLDPRAGSQKRGEARVHALEGHLVHDGHQAGESLREQVEDEFAPQVVAAHPIAKRGGRDDDGFGVLLHGGDGGKGILVEDGVGREDAGLSQPETVEGDLASRPADLVDAHHARDKQGNSLHAIAFEEDILSGGDARERGGLLEFADESRVRILEQGQGLGEAGELEFVQHDRKYKRKRDS